MKRKLIEFVEALPETRTVEINQGDTLCEFRFRTFAQWRELDRPVIICRAGPGIQHTLMSKNPIRYFCPHPNGKLGWIGIVVDEDLTWQTSEDHLIEAYELTAPKKYWRTA